MQSKYRLIPVTLLSLAIVFVVVGLLIPSLMGMAKLFGAIALVLTVLTTIELKPGKSMWD